MSTPVYSVVVPVYKTEPYIAACVESILCSMDRAGFGSDAAELILVDNGSPDRCGEICEEYAAKDGRIRVIHQENRNPGGGRNAGLHIARGEYVIFVDSDDLWEPELLPTLESLRNGGFPDLMVYGYFRLLENGKKEQIDCFPLASELPAGESGKEWLERLFQSNRTPPPQPWRYAFRRAMLAENHLEYREDLIGPEDFEFNMRAIPCAGSVAGTDDQLYDLRIRSSSTSTGIDESSYGRLLREIPVFAEMYRRMPVPVMAAAFVEHAAIVAYFPRRVCQPILDEIEKNRDIYKHVAPSFQRLLVPLTHIFGVYRGARIYTFLRTVKNANPLTRHLRWKHKKNEA